MSRKISALLFAAGLSALAARAQAVENFVATLTHSQETTQGAFTTSTGGSRPMSFGDATFQINDAGTELTFTSTIFNIDIDGTQTPLDANDNLAAAHIHVGAPPGQNAGVRWGFFGAPDNDIAPSDLVITPLPGGAVGGTFTSIWQAGEGNDTTLTDQLAGIRGGLAYINFHTAQFGGGEIRGQILIPEPAALTVLALPALLMMRRRTR